MKKPTWTDSEIRQQNERIALRAGDGYLPNEEDLETMLDIMGTLADEAKALGFVHVVLMANRYNSRVCDCVMRGGLNAGLINDIWALIRSMQAIRTRGEEAA